ncbi:SIR2 family protein [Saccharicrinis sp. FJH2]|uniref:SIR2 family protein n=1 Tax=Saccharicrinis sp. FJH65 TaxID=3344659 RepID=UPI0035F4BC60
MNEVFDIVSCDENRESQEKLFKLIESGEGVLFVGSGSSVRLNYPSWEGVLRDLSNKITEDAVKNIIEDKIGKGELLLAAEIIKSKIDSTEYNSAFESFFGPKKTTHDDFHKLLVTVRFKGFVTTNYDSVIESALKEIQNPLSNYGIIISEEYKSRVHYFLNSIVNAINYSERYHLYLHGKYNDPSSTILSYGDYVEKYDGQDIKNAGNLYDELIAGNLEIGEFESKSKLKNKAFRTLHYKAIYLLFASQRLVFTGFGLRDDYLNKVIDDIQEDFDPVYPNHFALMSNNGSKSWTRLDYLEEKKKWKSKGVELVFFNDDANYGGIFKFFQGLSPNSFLSDSIQPDHSASEVDTITVEPKTSENEEEDESINSKLLAKTRKTVEELKGK